jgi:hypothetical protein
MDAAFKWLMMFVGSQLLLIGLGLIPLEHWRSFRSRPSAGKKAIGTSRQKPQAAAG